MHGLGGPIFVGTEQGPLRVQAAAARADANGTQAPQALHACAALLRIHGLPLALAQRI